jgi:rhodanese-related sulfurtransferase
MYGWLCKLGLNRALGLLALVLGAGALFAQVYPDRTVTVHETELLTASARAEDHVPPAELAGWIVEGRADYRLIDLRDEKAFAEYHVPTAENVPLTDLGEHGLLRNEKIVLYSDGDLPAAQAWLLLRGRGYQGVYTLQGGLEAWKNQVLFPVMPENPTPEEQARFEEAAHVAKLFGGQPRAAASGGEAQLVDMSALQAAAPAVAAPSLPAAGGAAGARKRPREGC